MFRLVDVTGREIRRSRSLHPLMGFPAPSRVEVFTAKGWVAL